MCLQFVKLFLKPPLKTSIKNEAVHSRYFSSGAVELPPRSFNESGEKPVFQSPGIASEQNGGNDCRRERECNLFHQNGVEIDCACDWYGFQPTGHWNGADAKSNRHEKQPISARVNGQWSKPHDRRHRTPCRGGCGGGGRALRKSGISRVKELPLSRQEQKLNKRELLKV